MTTNINVTVTGSDLVDVAKIQQRAAREAQAEMEKQKKLEEEAEKEREEKLKAEDKDNQKKSILGTPIEKLEVNRRPTANVFGKKDNISMSWIVIGDNDWYGNIQSTASGYARALQSTYTGANNGRSLYISSTDGSSWFSLGSVPGTISGLTGSTSQRNDGNDTYRIDGGINDCVFDLFPAGKGNFVVTFRFTTGHYKANWEPTYVQFVPVAIVNYSPGVAVRTPLTISYKSFLVSTSAVKEINTPQGAKNYLDRKFPGVIETTRTLRFYVEGNQSLIEGRTSPDPNKTLNKEGGSQPTFDLVQAAWRYSSRGTKGLWWLHGWWQKAMPIPTGDTLSGEYIVHGSPAIYSRVLNQETDWINYFQPTDSTGAVNNTYNDFINWFINSCAQNQTKMIKPLAYYVASYLNIFETPMATELPIYQAKSAAVAGYTWHQGISPRIPPSNTNYWKLLKTLSFEAPAPMPEPPSPTAPFSQDSSGGGNYLCVTTDWGEPGYCKGQLFGLGFSSGDLTP